ncbi:MAG: hypothetical protein VKM01_01675 [Cyanobacteriota bacterium]|nr:hypothetical protein [Cyanobacteriota bacterium]
MGTIVLEQLRDLLVGPRPVRRLGALALVGLGWLLSPLCWWNDLLFNLPVALGVGRLVSLWNPDAFLAGVAAGYWLSNVVGILLMQTGALGLVAGERPVNRRRELLVGLATSSLYTLAIVALVKLGWLSAPLALIEQAAHR